MQMYNIPYRGKGVDETAYQIVVGNALRQETSGPELMHPRDRMRGKAWKRYRKPSEK